MRRLLTIACGVALLVLLGGCWSSATLSGNATGPPARILMVKDYILRALIAQDEQLTGTFAGRTTYVIGSNHLRPDVPALTGAVPTATYTSYAAFARDVAAGRLPPADTAVQYDIEKWPGTPLAEQRNPRHYMMLFSRLARARNLFPILAPGRDLVLVPGGLCTKQAGENLDQAYLRCGLAGADASAGAVVVQSQVDESDAARFRTFIAGAARQARSANAHVAVLAQLSTAPLGQLVPLGKMVAAARAAGPIVQGFSLNIRTSDVVLADQLLRSFRPA